MVEGVPLGVVWIPLDMGSEMPRGSDMMEGVCGSEETLSTTSELGAWARESGGEAYRAQLV